MTTHTFTYSQSVKRQGPYLEKVGIGKTGASNLFRGKGVVRLKSITFSNTETSNSTCYLKLYDSIKPTYGTTEPKVILVIPAGESGIIQLSPAEGLAFRYLSAAISKNAGKACSTAPDADVTIQFNL